MEKKNIQYNYDRLGTTYSGYRKTEPRIEKIIHANLREAKTVLNVGAGTGSYEPTDRYVVAVEPSATMRAQRQQNGKLPAINGYADSLPFDDRSFDASMAMITIHHWPDINKGLKELRRVTKDRVLILTCDPSRVHNFWGAEYFPDLAKIESTRFPSPEFIMDSLGGNCECILLPIPFDCVDGFIEAFYGRPEELLRKEVRKAQSAWEYLPAGREEILMKNFEKNLKSGSWDKKYGHLRKQTEFKGSLVLVVSDNNDR